MARDASLSFLDAMNLAKAARNRNITVESVSLRYVDDDALEHWTIRLAHAKGDATGPSTEIGSQREWDTFMDINCTHEAVRLERHPNGEYAALVTCLRCGLQLGENPVYSVGNEDMMYAQRFASPLAEIRAALHQKQMRPPR